MASIISHIVYANEFLRVHPKFAQTQEFMLGVCFPDIRRISNVTRAQTHNCFEELDLDFGNLKPFEAGWKFHVWCDMRRSELLLEKSFFELDQIHDCYYFSSYLVEDVLIWEKYNNWETLKSYLSNASFVDVFEQLTAGDWIYWFEMIGQYIGSKPDRSTMRKLIHNTPSFTPRTNLILNEVDSLLENKEVTKILASIHENILK